MKITIHLDRECRLGYEDGAEDRDGLVELSADARDDNEDLAGVVEGKSMGGEASKESRLDVTRLSGEAVEAEVREVDGLTFDAEVPEEVVGLEADVAKVARLSFGALVVFRS